MIDQIDPDQKGRCDVDVGAIVLVEAESRADESSSQSSVAYLNSATSFAGGAPAFLELFGRSLLEHAVDRLLGAQVKLISIVAHPDVAPAIPVFRRSVGNLSICAAPDTSPAVARILDTFWNNGCDCAFIVKPTAYMEADLPDFLDFHCQRERALTRASDRQGPLDLWIINCNPAVETFESSLHAALLRPDFFPAPYFVKEYVQRISHPQDFRQLANDAFLGRCHLRPLGEQVRPGVWSDQGAQLRRGARIVGPAYLGAGSTIGERAVITRFSNIERNSYIDYGTVVENSSVLPNTYVGMWLDVRHSIIHRNRLLNLERGVLVEVSDPRLLRANGEVSQLKQTPASVSAPEHPYEGSLPRASVVNRIRSISTSTEFES